MTRIEVLVVGAGPGGIAAATAAAENGRSVLVLDDNPAPGGQIWRSGVADQSKDTVKGRAIERLTRSGARVLCGHRVFDAPAPGTLSVIKSSGHAEHFGYEQLVLATGARERFLPFPGWTSPGVLGAGGLQALVKGGFSVRGKRVVVAGTGPLLLAVAAHLKDYGARVAVVAEQAGMSQLAPFGASLWSHPGKLVQGLGYRAQLRGTAYRLGCWPVSATAAPGGASLQSARLSDGRRSWDEPCDLLACGFHLVPNTELASLLGCRFRGAFVEVDARQQTSLDNVFCVGEPTGIGGLKAAIVQGEIAGLTCAGITAIKLERRATKERAFALRMERAFALRPEVLKLAADDTIVCRCEDVPLGALKGHTGWTDAKLQTRCGMGPCQGRICGPAAEALLGWTPASVRQPLSPVPLAAFCSRDNDARAL